MPEKTEATKAEENLVLNLTPDQAEYLRESINNYIEMVSVTYVLKGIAIVEHEHIKENNPTQYTEAMSLEYEELKEQAVQLDLALSRAWVIQILIHELLQLPLPEKKSNEEIIADYAKSLQNGDRTDEQDAAVSEDSEVLSTESKE